MPLDTSMYGRGGAGNPSIGEVLSGVQGVMSIVGRSREKKKEQKEIDDNEYLNTVFGKNMANVDPNDQNAVLQATQKATGEVLLARPELYSKITPEIGKAVKAVRDAEIRNLEVEGKALENKDKSVDLETKKLDRTKKFFENQLWKIDRIGEELSGISESAQPDIDYNDSVNYLKSLGIDASLPDYQTFAQNPAAIYGRAIAQKQQLKKSLEDIDKKLKTSQLGEQQSQEKKTAVEADYIQREKEAGLAKTYADINKKKVGYDSDAINQIKEKMLADPGISQLVKLYSNGNISEQEMMAKMPGFGGAKAGDVRMALTSAAIEMNPPQYDENENLIGGFSPKQFSIARGSEAGSTRYNARMQDTKVTTANSAMVLINHVIDPTTEKISNMESITPQFAAELALNAARLVSPSGQVGIELMREFKQGTLQENISRTLAYFGLQSAGTTEANLKNIKAFIKREGELAQKTRDAYYSGEGKNVGFDAPNLTGGIQKQPANIPENPTTSFDELWAKHGGK